MACTLPKEPVKVYIEYSPDQHYNSSYMAYLEMFLEADSFEIVEQKGEDVLKFYFISDLDRGLFIWSDSDVSILIGNLEKKIMKRYHFTVENICAAEHKCYPYEHFAQELAYKIKKAVFQQDCSLNQAVFDVQIKKERDKEVKKILLAKKEMEREKQRQDAVKKLVEKKEYDKLAKILRLKNEYSALLDKKAQLLFLGSYSIWDISKDIQAGANKKELIQKILQGKNRYKSKFSKEERKYLKNLGLSSEIIESLQNKTKQEDLRLQEQHRLALQESKKQKLHEVEDKKEELQNKSDSSYDTWGKIAAIGIGAAAVNQSSLDDTAKMQFLTNYSQDVLNNDMSIRKTNNWKNTTTAKHDNSSVQKKSSTSPTHCKASDYPGYLSYDPQLEGQCKMAWFYACNKEKYKEAYPQKVPEFNRRIETYCSTLNGFISRDECPVCAKYINKKKRDSSVSLPLDR